MTRLLNQLLATIKIKHKLLILVIFPFAGFVSLAGLEVSEQYRQWRDAEQIAVYQVWSVRLLELMVGLQAEHGYVQAYHYSRDEIFHQRYKANQLQVDRGLAHLRALPHPANKRIPELESQIFDLLAYLGQIDVVRGVFEENELDDRYADFYRDASSKIERINQTLSIKNTDTKLSNLYRAEHVLWQLMKWASDERALIYQLVGGGRVDTVVFREVNALFRQQQAQVEELRYLAEFPGNERLFSVLKVTADNSPLNQLRQQVVRKVGNDELVSRLLSHLGFGGLIHSYKNYMVRNDVGNLLEIRRHQRNARLILNSFERTTITEEQRRAIRIVEETLGEYTDALRIINLAHEQGVPVHEIDRRVRIDNAKMLNAIQRTIGGKPVDPVRWGDLITAHIEEIQLVANRFAGDILQQIEAREQTVSAGFAYWSMLVVSLFVVSLGIAFFVAWHITGRISKLNAALRYIIESYDFSHRLPDGGGDEIAYTKTEFNRLVGHLEDQYDAQERQRSALQELISDLETKQHIIDKDEELAQQVFAKITRAGSSGLDNVRYWNRPMTNFSGDLVVSEISDTGFTYIMMCDFTGHGLPAALGALPVSTVFYPMAKKDCSVSDIVREINQKLLTLLPTAYFCCASLLVLDRNRQSCIYWNGGLPPLLHYSRLGELKATLRGEHLPLGIAPYALEDSIPQEIILEPGDGIYVYTDGLTEADNLAGEMYDEHRLMDVLNFPLQTDGRIPIVRASVEAFITDNPPSDDISIVEMVA